MLDKDRTTGGNKQSTNGQLINEKEAQADNEENMLLRKSENNTTYIRARHVFYSRITFGGNTLSVHTLLDP